ncbi:ab9c1a7c-92a4-4264-bc1a-1567d6cba7c4 [Sclerotinia trifoliorum]|uniref:Ab9c1a7c-92a4-4264-bc1a-1567d6cba7c4 n=1 Tax=Sclerotinia trifoliorum TaxID=28548 RepID=A0A8H2VN05_9HELO|nr:ab9c1a7c-92a4-4264-bc1a-1567d6cba7c4 [Sclerotinia trifoliorum]
MSTTRLTFLYPTLFRAIRASEPITPRVRIQSRRASRPQRPRQFCTTQSRRDVFVQRHGKAVEPFLKEGENESNVKVFLPEKEVEEEEEEENTKGAKVGRESQKSSKPKDNDGIAERGPSSASPLSEETQAASTTAGDPGVTARSTTAQGPEQLTPRQQAAVNTGKMAPLETVLHMPPPESAEVQNSLKPPHLQTPPYVHHFDTYALVQQVQQGGFTKDQSITSMKAVRELLALNLDVAKEGLVSKSDVENETYLFRAACSELKAEIQNNRKANEEKMRRERTLLQHEVDILNQKLTQELLILKDDLKGMFDDRKMTVRQEQRTMETGIQELNYKITVMLNSDAKSEIEGLRWVLTRRSVMGILFMAFMVLTSLRYASYKAHEHEERRRKEAEIHTKHDEHIQDLPSQGAAEILAAN